MTGGRREGAGRPRGAKNKRTLESEAEMKAAAEELAATMPSAFPGDGVAYLQSVYKNPENPLRLRIDAAAKAARFERSIKASSRPLPEAEPASEATPSLFQVEIR